MIMDGRETMRKHYFCSNEASNLFDIAILAFAVGIFANLTLNHSCQLYTALHILALNEFEDDITLRRFRVESLISLLIVLLPPHSRLKA